MYTHIELWLSSVLLLLRRRKKDQRQEGILQETWHLDNYIYSHSCPRDICICQFIILFCKFVLFYVILPVLGVWVEVIHQKKQQHITGLKIFCSLCPALCVQGCTSCTYSPSRSHCTPLRVQGVVFMHWSLRWGRTKAWSEGKRQWAGATRGKRKWESIIPVEDCLVTVIVQKY